MKIIKILFTFLILLSGCFTDRAFSRSEIEDVGGMKTGEIVIKSGQYFLPVICNVSGTETITNKPKTMNSGLAFKEINYKITGDKILFSLYVTLVGDEYKFSRSNGINFKFGDIQKIKYQLYYKNPDNTIVFIKQLVFTH